MNASSLIRWGGFASIISGLLLGFSIIVRFSGAFLAAQASSFTAVLIMIFALTALYAAQAERGGRLAFAGYLLAVIGGILSEVVSFLWMATYAGIAEAHTLVMFAWGTVPILHIAVLGTGIGLMMFGIATVRAGVFSRWAGILMAAGIFVYTLSEYLPMAYNLALPAVLTVCASLIWMGVSIVFTGRSRRVELAAAR